MPGSSGSASEQLCDGFATGAFDLRHYWGRSFLSVQRSSASFRRRSASFRRRPASSRRRPGVLRRRPSGILCGILFFDDDYCGLGLQRSAVALAVPADVSDFLVGSARGGSGTG